MAKTFSRSDLLDLEFLNSGGFGGVYRVVRHSLPPGMPALAFKKFTTKVDEQAASAKRVVDFRENLSLDDRDELDQYSVWPLALIEDGGKVCGLLMPLIPGDFFFKVQGKDKPRGLDWLITTNDQRVAAEADLGEVDRPERLMVLAQLLYVIGRLHKLGWVFGDVSFKNAVFALNPPRLKLLDCDAAAPLSDLKREQFSTHFWDPPECPIGSLGLQDTRSDTYKLALAIVRGLVPGRGGASSRSPGRVASELDAIGVALLARALSGDPALRPPTKDLYQYLRDTVLPLVKIPVIRTAELARPAILRGLDARIRWDMDNVSEVTIVHGNNTRLPPVKLADHPDGYAFHPDLSGPVTIELQGRYQDLKYGLGDLILYDLPDFDVNLANLPRPVIPAIEAFSLEPVAAMLTGRPRLEIGAIQFPPIPSPPAFDLVEKLLPEGLRKVALPRIDTAVTEASNALKNQILVSGLKYGASLRRAKLGV
jgi:serine/threonine protein kinase